MKRALALGLLTVLLVIGVGCFGTPQREISPDTFATFADLCRHKSGLTPAAQRTVDELLRDAETRKCDQAEAVLTGLTTLKFSITMSFWQRHQPKPIVDIAPLGSLTQLDMGWNPITSAAPLSNLTQLTKLVLNHSQVSDVTPLANLTQLTELDLSGNPIGDITPPSWPDESNLARPGRHSNCRCVAAGKLNQFDLA
ncbi:MAG: leucine-rich repeat domain-containing protein [Cyanobacteria bacterium J06626_4]